MGSWSDLPEAASITDSEAALIAALVPFSGVKHVVETGTLRGVGTRRLRAALPDDVTLTSIDVEPLTDLIPGVECVIADSTTWTPPGPIGVLVLDCEVPRDAAYANLAPHVVPGGSVVVHDGQVFPVKALGGTVIHRLQIGAV